MYTGARHYRTDFFSFLKKLDGVVGYAFSLFAVLTRIGVKIAFVPDTIHKSKVFQLITHAHNILLIRPVGGEHLDDFAVIA